MKRKPKPKAPPKAPPPIQPPFRLPTVNPPPPDDGDDHQPTDVDGLTVRQRAFVIALSTPGQAFGVASRAAAAAGYNDNNTNSLRVTASRLLTNANVRRAVRVQLAALRDNPDFRRTLLVTRASVSMEDFLTFEDGKPRLDWEAAAAAGAVGSVKKYKEMTDLDGNVIGHEVEVYDAADALKLLFQLDGKLKTNPDGAAAISVTVNLLGDEED